jgi:hypothetical protein
VCLVQLPLVNYSAMHSSIVAVCFCKYIIPSFLVPRTVVTQDIAYYTRMLMSYLYVCTCSVPVRAECGCVLSPVHFNVCGLNVSSESVLIGVHELVE